jgi:predicted DNA-binding transcriptional regulator YafY
VNHNTMPRVRNVLYSRPPLARMLQIHDWLQREKYPNCNTMAREIEVSSRTIMRDLEFMKCRLNLPIAYHPQRYGFYYESPVDDFPNVPVTEAEVFAMLIAQKAVAQYRGTPFERPLQTAFQRLTSQLGQQTAYSLGSLEQAVSFRPFAPGDTDLQIFEVLARAVQEKRAVQFQYTALGNTRAQLRKVHPYHLACIDSRWYLFAHDTTRKAMRTFHLARMRQPELTAKTFVLPRTFSPQEYLRGTFNAFTGSDDFEVVIHFDAWAGQLVRERRWHGAYELESLPGGGVRLRLRLNNIEEIHGWILSWGCHATVVRPNLLVERIRATLAELAARYASMDEQAPPAPGRERTRPLL